jgi:predicted nucleic acid-binding protein
MGWTAPASGIAAAADLVVTGDRHLLALGAYGAIGIITPRAFLDMVAE